MDIELPTAEDKDHNVVETTEIGEHSAVDSLYHGDNEVSDKRDEIFSARQSQPNETLSPLQQFLQPPVGNGFTSGSASDRSSSLLSVQVQSDPHTQPAVSVKIPPPKFKPLPYATSRSGLVYDVRMRFHQDPYPDDTEGHPEDPRRIAEIFNELKDAGLAPDPEHPENDSDYQLVRIGIRQATEAEICLVHTPEHLEWVRSLENLPMDILREISRPLRANSVYLHNLTWQCASLSAGGAIEATKAVVAGQVKNSVAIIRPPGHHAEHAHPEGFCFFNNVCIAARVAQQDFPEVCRKVLILDWDVHHGNGIQRDFYEDPNVLYVSIHVHENGTFYPRGDYGDHQHCGAGRGLGRNINIPWSRAHMGDAEYIYAFQQVIMPVAIEFDPDLVIVAAGFDAADGDPLGECHVSPACYGHMTHMLMQLAQGKIVACLEGGYNLRSIAKSALSMTRVLMGEPPERLPELKPTIRGVDTVHLVIRTQSRFWKSLYPKYRDLLLRNDLGSERLHDIIRDWQSKKFWEEHNMLSLYVLRQRISKSFENQVLATQNYYEARPLLVVFHDPPDAYGIPNPRTSQLELHNTWLTDVSKKYVDWAVKHEFAVIDVNIPKHLTGIENETGYEEADREEKRAEETKELAHYLWQNYIETGDSTHIFFIGVGDTYIGIMDLLSEHRTAINHVDFTIAFVGESSLRAMNRPGDEATIIKFFRNSQIFVANDHPACDGRKLRKKHGRVIQSPVSKVQEMLFEHFDEVTDKLLELSENWREGQLPAVRVDDLDEVADNNAPYYDIHNVRSLPADIEDTAMKDELGEGGLDNHTAPIDDRLLGGLHLLDPTAGRAPSPRSPR